MEVVHFSEELAARAPSYFSPMCEAPSGKKISLIEVVEAMRRREVVTIRPASDSEMKRAEAAVAMFEIALKLGEKLDTLLDQDTPAVRSGALTALRDAMESANVPPMALFDRKN